MPPAPLHQTYYLGVVYKVQDCQTIVQMDASIQDVWCCSGAEVFE